MVIEHPEVEWLAVGKRAGLDFSELHRYRIRDLARFAESMFTEREIVRDAQQADIDQFLT